MKRYFLVVSLLCLMFMLSGCGEKNKEFVKGDNELVHLTSTPKGGVETYEIYTTNIMIYVDGRVRIYASDFVKWFGADDIPELTFYISEDDVKEIEQLIIEQDIYNLRENVGNKDGISGVKKYITVYSADGTHTTGGISVSNRQFVRAYDRIENIVREELYLYQTEINQTQKKGYIIYTNRCVEFLDRTGNTLVNHEYINNVYTYEEETEDGSLYYTAIEFNTYGLELLKEATYGASDEDVVVLSLHLNNTFETNIAIKSEISDGRLLIPQDTEEAANRLTEKIQGSLR